MKLTGPLAVPPELSSSLLERILRQVDARAGAAAEDQALFLVPVENGLDRVVHGQDEAGADLLG